MYMLALGPFPFGTSTAGYDKLQRSMQFKHAAAVRVGDRDAYQKLGPGEEQINLAGTVAPSVTGTLASITRLEDMGRGGEAYLLVDGAGYVYGTYHIDSLQTTQRGHFADGTPRLVEFSLTLTRDDSMPANEKPETSQQAAK
ncbi:phage tail protein [Luteibacter mycovicinus]|uniref:phage tail protein n=1 Tax=Luteibacter mycovicinus TaxID=1500890 RepID=UPI00068B7A62|nr:phage tail protein [Luteibacter sp. 9143a]